MLEISFQWYSTCVLARKLEILIYLCSCTLPNRVSRREGDVIEWAGTSVESRDASGSTVNADGTAKSRNEAEEIGLSTKKATKRQSKAKRRNGLERTNDTGNKQRIEAKEDTRFPSSFVRKKLSPQRRTLKRINFY